mgnify:CR=1 FL=1
MNILKKLKLIIFKIIFFPRNSYRWVISRYNEFTSSVESFFHHFKIIREANITLGKYHMQQGNHKEASLRFWLTDKLFAKNDSENLYWSAWNDILLKDYAKAIKKLENNDFDKINLKNYVQNMSSVQTIPKEICEEFESLTQDYSYKRYIGEKNNLFDNFFSSLIPYIPKFEDKDKKFRMLEIASSPELCARVKEFLPKDSEIETVNFFEDHTKLVESYNKDTSFYSSVKTIPRGDFSDFIQPHYNLIIAFDSISYTSKIGDIFKIFRNALDSNGLLALVLPKAEFTKLDPSECRFNFSKNDIESKLKLAEFMPVSITTIILNKSNEYYLVLAK